MTCLDKMLNSELFDVEFGEFGLLGAVVDEVDDVVGAELPVGKLLHAWIFTFQIEKKGIFK